MVMEPIACEWVSQMQRGFLPNRSLLASVVDIDYEAMRVSLKSERGMLILFDSRQPFPAHHESS